MKVIYRAFDGTEFDTQQECLGYETKNPPFIMFSPKEKENNFENCAIVKIHNEEQYNMLCDMCRAEDYEVPDFYFPRNMVYPILAIYNTFEGVWTCVPNNVLQVLEDNAAEIFKED